MSARTPSSPQRRPRTTYSLRYSAWMVYQPNTERRFEDILTKCSLLSCMKLKSNGVSSLKNNVPTTLA